MNETANRQPFLDPLQKGVLRLVGRVSAHDRTFRKKKCRRCGSADPDTGIGDEFVGRQQEVGRRRAFADAPGSIVHRAVAGAEIAAILALMRERDTTQMRADADYY